MIVEVIGLAGAGKSSLRRALLQEGISTFTRGLAIRNPQNLPYFVGSGIRVAPTLLGPPWRGRWYDRAEVARLFYLTGMSQVFARMTSDGQPLLIDQGPIFEMATLRAFGPPRLLAPQHATWWDNRYAQWAATLDLIIWLEAPPEVLEQRIRSREKWHAVKEGSLAEMLGYLQRYQMAYEHVVSQLIARRSIAVLTFDTSTISTATITSEILNQIQFTKDAEIANKTPALAT